MDKISAPKCYVQKTFTTLLKTAAQNEVHIADDERINGGYTTSVFESGAKQEAHGQHYSPRRLADHEKKPSLNNILMRKNMHVCC